MQGAGFIKVKDARKIEIKAPVTMIETYNADQGERAPDGVYSEFDDNGNVMVQVVPPKYQMITEIMKLIKLLKDAKEHKNNLDFN